MATWDAVWGVVTFAAGMASTYVGKAVDERRAVKREERTREADRDKLVLDRRESFELTHLQDLHAALSDLARIVSQLAHLEERSLQTTGVYGRAQLPGDVDEELGVLNRRVRELAGLVLNDNLRGETEAAHMAMVRFMRLKDATLKEAQRKHDEADVLVDTVQERIAARLREIYRS